MPAKSNNRSSQRTPQGEVKQIIMGRDGPRPAYLIDPDRGCWISTGASQGGNYRMMNSKPAHRAAYEAVQGPIAPKSQVHHLCFEPACINPSHIVALSRKDH